MFICFIRAREPTPPQCVVGCSPPSYLCSSVLTDFLMEGWSITDSCLWAGQSKSSGSPNNAGNYYSASAPTLEASGQVSEPAVLK